MRNNQVACAALAILFALILPGAVAAQVPGAGGDGLRLAVFVAPNPALAGTTDENIYLFVQLQDAAGNPVMPAAASGPLTVTLASSNPSVLKPYGSDGHLVQPGSQTSSRYGRFVSPGPGEATVTATAPGFAPVSATVTTVPRGKGAVRLKLLAVPPRLAVGETGLFLAQFLDAQGQPANPARSLNVTIEASMPGAAPVRREAWCYDSFTTTKVDAAVSQQAGVTTLTASAPGISGDTVQVHTVAPGSAAKAPTTATTTADPSDLESQALRLGTQARLKVQADLANAEAIVADHYRQVMALSTDEALEPRLTDAFRRGYERAILPDAPSPAADRPYSHPRANFDVMVPAGWTLSEQAPPADLQMKTPAGDALMEITSGPTSVALDPVSYAAGWESHALGPDKLLRRKREGHPFRINDDRSRAYEGVYEGEAVLVKVVFVSLGDRFVVLTGVFAPDDFAKGEAIFDRMVLTLRTRVSSK